MNLLGMFAKHPAPGEVKSRLAETLGPQRACDLYRAFLSSLLERFQSVGERRVVVYSPENRQAEFANLADNAWSLEPQAAGDLGERMRSFLETALRSGASRVVLIGSDSPTLPIAYVEQAFRCLEQTPVVLGPSCDGGYYLLGAAGCIPPVFENIAWSTSAVFAQTAERLQQAHLPFATLGTWYDIDTAADLTRLREELASPRLAADPAFASLRKAMDAT